MKQIKHFTLNLNSLKMGTPACECYSDSDYPHLAGLPEEVTDVRKRVTCKNCRKTRVFRKLN